MIKFIILLSRGKILINDADVTGKENPALKCVSMTLGVMFWLFVICLLYVLFFISKQVFFFFFLFFTGSCGYDFACAWLDFVFFADKEGFL